MPNHLEPSPSGDLYEVDCAIVGGGPAGLSAAVNLARLRRSVLVIDDRDGRSLWGQINRNYLGFPAGIPAAQIRLAGRQQAVNYGARFLSGRVTDATAGSGRFRLRIEPCLPRPADVAGKDANAAAEGALGSSLGEECIAEPLEISARTLVIATGVRDAFPRFGGWELCVGVSLFWCIACDGYEAIDRRVGVVGDDSDAVETALELTEFTHEVFIVAGNPHGFDVPEARLADLELENIAAYPCTVAEYVNHDGQISALVLDDAGATVIPTEQVFAYRRPSARTEVALMLGVALNNIGQIIVDSEGHTNVAGIYAAGDVTSLHDHQVSAAVHEGNQAAAAANYYLYRPVQRAPGALAR